MIDNIIVIVYLAGIMCVGIYSKYNHALNLNDFANIKDINTSSNKLLLTATIFGSSVGGVTIFGISERVFTLDASYVYGLMIAILADLLIGTYLPARLIKYHGTQSVGDIMYEYYGTSGRLISGIMAIIVSIGFIAAQISVSGHIFEYMLNINYIYGVVCSYGIVIIYTTLGGLRSVLFTNLLQSVTIIISIPIITIIGIKQIGIGNFIHSMPVEKIMFSQNSTLLSNTISHALSFTIMSVTPSLIQRMLINQNPQATTKAIYTKSFIYFILLIIILLNGLITYHMYSEQYSNNALFYLINQIIPTGIQGLIIIGLLSAVMSTTDADLNITSTTIAKDVFAVVFNIKDQKKLLYIAQITNCIIGTIAIIIAINFDSVVELIIFMSGFWGSTVLIPFIFCLFGITVSIRMMFACAFFGSTTFLLWENLLLASYFTLKGIVIGTIVNCIIFCASKKYRPI